MSTHQQRALSSVTSSAGGTAAAFATVSSSTPATSLPEVSTTNISNTYSTSAVADNNDSSGGGNSTYIAPLANAGHADTTEVPISSSVSTAATATAPSSTNLNNYYESLRNNVITLLEHVRLPPAAGHQNTISCSTTAATNTFAATAPMSVVASNHSMSSYSTHPTLIPPNPLPTASIVTSNGGVPMYGSAAHHLATGHALGPPPSLPNASLAAPPTHAYTVHHPAGYAHHHHHEHFDSYISKLQSLCVPADVYDGPFACAWPVFHRVKESLHQAYTLMPTPI